MRIGGSHNRWQKLLKKGPSVPIQYYDGDEGEGLSTSSCKSFSIVARPYRAGRASQSIHRLCYIEFLLWNLSSNAYNAQVSVLILTIYYLQLTTYNLQRTNIGHSFFTILIVRLHLANVHPFI